MISQTPGQMKLEARGVVLRNARNGKVWSMADFTQRPRGAKGMYIPEAVAELVSEGLLVPASKRGNKHKKPDFQIATLAVAR